MKEHINIIYLLLDNYDRRDFHGLLCEFFEEILASNEYAAEEHRGGLATDAHEIPDVFTALYELRDLLENVEDDAQKINGRNKNECFHLNNIHFFCMGTDWKYELFHKEFKKWFPVWLKSKTSADCRYYRLLDAKTFRNHFFKILAAVFKLDLIKNSGFLKDLEEHDIDFHDDNTKQ